MPDCPMSKAEGNLKNLQWKNRDSWIITQISAQYSTG